jgi:hypothetical protein
MTRVFTRSIFLAPGARIKSRPVGVLRSGVDQALVEDLVRGVGYSVLKLVTAGTYRSGGNGFMLEGCVGLSALALLFFCLHRFVT